MTDYSTHFSSKGTLKRVVAQDTDPNLPSLEKGISFATLDHLKTQANKNKRYREILESGGHLGC